MLSAYLLLRVNNMAIILNFGGKIAVLILFRYTVFVHHYRSDSFSNHSCYLSVMKSKFVDGDLCNNDVKLRHLSELVFGTVHSSTSLCARGLMRYDLRLKYMTSILTYDLVFKVKPEKCTA